MMYLVLAVAIANLGLGYLAAATLMEPPLWTDLRFRLPKFRLRFSKKGKAQAQGLVGGAPASIPIEQALAAHQMSHTENEVPAPATIAGVDELPAQWLQEMASEGVVPESFVEGAAQALRLEVVRYRQHLIAAEERCRGLAPTLDPNAISALAGELQIINRDWLERQTAAAVMLAQRAGRLGDHEAAAAALEQVLLDQAAEIQGICANLETHGTRGDVDGGIKPLAEGISTLVDQAHVLRDRMFDLLATLLRTGSRLESIALTSQVDPGTGVPNRTGLESLLAKWWQDDPERSRMLSIVLVDIDRTARLNQRFGTRVGDQAVVCLSKLFNDLVRKEGGTDRLARLGGQSFLIMMGDAGPREALTAAERLRQTVEATTLDHRGAEFELTVSCGVIEVGHAESVMDMLRRAGETLRFAKKAGRNRCSIDEGNGPSTLEPPQFPVQGRVLKLGES